MEDWVKEERDRYWDQLCQANQRIGALEYHVRQLCKVTWVRNVDKERIRSAKSFLDESNEKK